MAIFYIQWKIYEQCDGVSMGSALGPPLANVFICHFEDSWLENCPAHFKPIVYRWFINTILLFSWKDHVEKFKNYLSKQHGNIYLRNWGNSSLSFLDITITCENKFVT